MIGVRPKQKKKKKITDTSFGPISKVVGWRELIAGICLSLRECEMRHVESRRNFSKIYKIEGLWPSELSEGMNFQAFPHVCKFGFSE